MDHYRVLGLSREATRDEIKEAFRKLAVKYHPDKHSQSPKTVREDATLRFKQVSEAYEVLGDDLKRSHYDFQYKNYNSNKYGRSYSNYGYGYGYDNTRSASASAAPYGDGVVSKFEIAIRYMTTRAFLLNCAFAGYGFFNLRIFVNIFELINFEVFFPLEFGMIKRGAHAMLLLN